MARVALVRCDSYDLPEVRSALSRALSLLGGAERFVQPGQSVVLKPNLLAGELPEKAVSTHPSVMLAIAESAMAAGARVTMGDSPAVGAPKRTAERCGLGPVYESGAGEADFETITEVEFRDGRVGRRFPMARAVHEADVVIDCAKLKTHVQQTYTGGVKNLFGCLVGLNKARTHLQFPDRQVFADFLLDLYLAVRPALTIIDAVVGMEGDGPRSGRPRPMRALIVAEDALAADLVALEMIGFDAGQIPIIAAARRRGIEPARIEQVQVLGDGLDLFRVNDFVRPSTSPVPGPRFIQELMRKTLVPRPEVMPGRCVRCGECIRLCPPQAIQMELEGPRIDLERCIRCYSCHEACSQAAIALETGFWGKRVQRWLGRSK